VYNLRNRVRAVPAGSVRPHLGMRVRAPPTVASQVTPTQAMEILDDVYTVLDTEMPKIDSDKRINTDESVVKVESEEAPQPPNLTPYTCTPPQRSLQGPRTAVQ